ncbi:hypothetical protein RCL1_007272 [Eukaryota sp. TZLM3-RCL]
MTNSCVHKNCDYSLSDFTFVRNLSGGAQGQTSIRRGKDGKLYCFKTVTAPPSGTLPEEKFMFNELRSPFLVDLLHCFVVDGLMYLCMEYCEGGSLFELLESNIDLSDEDILFIFVQLAHGLNHLHGKSIIHRDIKPGNIVLTSRTPPYRVKYCDFGVSKQVENTMARTFIGTFQFMAPEVVAIWYGEVPANHHYTPAVDIWSLGVVLYLLKEKRYPFKNPNEILSGNIPTSNSLFGEIIRKLMVFDASRRISAEQLVNLPEIKQVYDFIENFDENLFSKYQIWIMKKEIDRQSNLIGRLESTVNEQNSKISSQNSEILCLKSTVESQNSKISSQNSEILCLKSTVESQNSKISSQNSEIELLKSHQEQSKNAFESKISSQNSKIQQLESKLAQTYLLSSDQSNLIDQFKELLPFISQLQAAEEKRRIEEKRLLEIKRKEDENARKLAEEERRVEQQKQNEFNTTTPNPVGNPQIQSTTSQQIQSTTSQQIPSTTSQPFGQQIPSQQIPSQQIPSQQIGQSTTNPTKKSLFHTTTPNPVSNPQIQSTTSQQIQSTTSQQIPSTTSQPFGQQIPSQQIPSQQIPSQQIPSQQIGQSTTNPTKKSLFHTTTPNPVGNPQIPSTTSQQIPSQQIPSQPFGQSTTNPTKKSLFHTTTPNPVSNPQIQSTTSQQIQSTTSQQIPSTTSQPFGQQIPSQQIPSQQIPSQQIPSQQIGQSTTNPTKKSLFHTTTPNPVGNPQIPSTTSQQIPSQQIPSQPFGQSTTNPTKKSLFQW